jgi:hypothetical protein
MRESDLGWGEDIVSMVGEFYTGFFNIYRGVMKNDYVGKTLASCSTFPFYSTK